MQLLSGGDAWINNDWHLFGTKCLSIFCGVWEKGNQNPQLSICLSYDDPQDHRRLRFELKIWRFELTIEMYDTRHWNPYTNSWINTEDDQLEYERQWEADEDANSYVKECSGCYRHKYKPKETN